jgi:diguanylate cyclase (GGDEF)-like protein
VHGHLEGNRVLKVVAAALKECCRGYDYVARTGGDEFVILAPDIDRAALEEKTRRFRDAIDLTALRLGFEGLSSSIGAAVFMPSEESHIDGNALLAEADRKMYANKRRNKALSRVQLAGTELRGITPKRVPRKLRKSAACASRFVRHRRSAANQVATVASAP